MFRPGFFRTSYICILRGEKNQNLVSDTTYICIVQTRVQDVVSQTKFISILHIIVPRPGFLNQLRLNSSYNNSKTWFLALPVMSIFGVWPFLRNSFFFPFGRDGGGGTIAASLYEQSCTTVSTFDNRKQAEQRQNTNHLFCAFKLMLTDNLRRGSLSPEISIWNAVLPLKSTTPSPKPY